MIVLIDDKISRIGRYLKNLEKENYSFFKTFLFNDENKLTDDIQSHLKNTELIILHDSYNGKKRITSEIKRILPDVNIILFSGGFTTNMTEESIQVEAYEMYKNLPKFLEYYKINNRIKVEILLYGKFYLRNELIGLNYKVGLQTYNLDSDFPLNNTDELDDIIDVIDDTLKSEELKDEKEKLIKAIEEDKELTVEKLRKIINKLVFKYV